MKKKSIICISILLILGLSINLQFMNSPNVDVIKTSAIEKNVKSINKQNYREVELNNSNCIFTVNEQESAIKIEEYKGNEDCVIIPEKIEGYNVESINTKTFSDCYNLETIKVPVKIAEKIGEIPDFEINEEINEEGYVVYSTTREYSETYKGYLSLTDEEKLEVGIIPNKYNVPIEKIYSSEMQELYGNREVTSTSTSSFDLRDYIDIEVENQKAFGNCYAYASFSSVETNLALLKNELIDLSEIHGAVMTTGYGGTTFLANMDYYATKIGPVHEEDLSMEEIYENFSNQNYIIINNYLSGNSISSSQLKQIQSFVSQEKAVKQVTQTTVFPSITHSMKQNSSYKEMIEIERDMIKEHIRKYGSIATCIAMSQYVNYNGNMVLNNSTSNTVDHGVSIVGWDDNFSRYNFPSEIRPQKNGAYLVLNSWGEAWGNDGYFWVSYEDKFIEEYLVGVVAVEEIAENIVCNSMSVKDLATDEILKTAIIEKGQEVQIDLNLTATNVFDNYDIKVTLRNSERDFTEELLISGDEFIGNTANISIILDSIAFQGGQYILEIEYANEIISRTIEILADFKYELNTDGTITLTKYIGEDKNVIIPSEYDRHLVTRIGAEAFSETYVQTVTIPNGVIEIGEYAFYNCVDLEEINLPNTLIQIESNTFLYCTSLETIKIPNSVKTIGEYAFYACESLEKVELSEGVEKIELRAFENCYNLKEINLDKNVKEIGEYAFYGCESLEEISFSNKMTNISEGTFMYCSGLKSVKISESIKNIGIGAFQYCTSLKEIKIPRNVTTLGQVIFYECTNLEKIVIFKETTSIGQAILYRVPNAVIYCEDNSTAKSYAISNNYKYCLLSNYTITYNSNSENDIVENMPETQEKVEYDDISISEKIPKRAGHRFEGWALEKNATEKLYSPGQKYQENSDLNLYAVWKDGRIEIDINNYKFEDKNVIYDGTEKTIESENYNTDLLKVEYIIKPLENSSLKNQKAINVGKYEITAKYSIIDTSSYVFKDDLNTKKAILTIEKATKDMSKVKFESAIFDYDGEEHTITITGELPDGVNVEYENNKGTDVGTFEAIAKFTIIDETERANYNEIPNKTATLEIVPVAGTIEITNIDELNRTYNGKAVEVKYEAKIGDKIVEDIVVEYINNATNETTSEAPINAGTYKVKVTLEETENYAEVSDEATFTIEKATKDMSKVAFEDETHIYDGTEKEILISGELPEGVKVEYENNTATNVGKYNAIAKFIIIDEQERANYNEIPNMEAILEITPVIGSIEITNIEELNRVYNGEAVEVKYEAKIGDKIVEDIVVEYINNATNETTSEAPINAGTYKVKVTLEETENYAEVSDEATFTIEKATKDMSKVTFEDETHIYDGTEKEILISGELPEGVKVEYENNTATNVGKYNAIAKFIIIDEQERANYNEIPNMEAVLEITTAEGSIKITNIEELNRVYNGEAVEVKYEATGNRTVIVEYTNNVTGELLEEAPINAGTYKVKVILEANENYAEVSVEEIFTIEKATKDMSKVTFEDVTLEYDGTEKEILISGELPEGVKVEYENNTAINVGKYNAIAKFIIIDEQERANYNEIPNIEAVLEITTAEGSIKITNIEELNRVYNGEAVEVKYEAKIGDKIVEDIVVEYINNATNETTSETPINAGTYKVKVTLEETENYAEVSVEATFTIEKATKDMSKVAFEDETHIYDGTEKEILISGELPEGVKVEYENNTATNVGKYNAIAKFIIIDEQERANYNEIPNMEAVLEITTAEGSIKITNIEELNRVYNGEAVEVKYEAKIGDKIIEDIAVEYINNATNETTSEAPINAGTYKVKVTLEETENYAEVSDEATFTIEKATKDMSKVAFEDATYEYDGEQKEIVITGELPEGVRVEYENNTATDVGKYTAIAKFTIIDEKERVNYNEIPNIEAVLEITTAEGSIKITNIEELNRIYNGEAVEVKYEAKIGDKIIEDIVVEYTNNVTGELLEEAPINAGTYKVKVTLEETENYAEVSDEAIFTIEKATKDMSKVAFEDATYEYDGEQKEIVITGELPEGVRVEYENNTATDVGKYTAIAKFTIIDEKERVNYNEIPNMEAVLEITPLTGKIKIKNKYEFSKQYDGTEVIAPEYEKTREGNVRIEYYEGREATGTVLNYVPVNAGVYTVKVVLEAYEGYLETSDQETFEIFKATYDMSGVTFEDATYEYDGEQKEIVITGELPEGVSVEYYNNYGTDAGEYEAIARFIILDTHNYNAIENMRAKLIITKKAGSIIIKNKESLDKVYDKLPAIEIEYDVIGDGAVVIEYYEGEELSGEMLQETPVNAGTYTVKAILKEGTNYVSSSDKTTFTIEKATYDMSNIKFEDATYEYDGTEKEILITGEVPEGVNVIYENNSHIEIGTYEVIAKFEVEDDKNYNVPDSMSARLIITPIKDVDFGEYVIIEEEGITYIEKIESNLTVQEFKQKFPGVIIEVYENGTKVQDSELIKTGMEVSLTNKDSTKKYQVLIKGDITRDGNIDEKDLLMLARYIVEFEDALEYVNEASLRASDLHEDGVLADNKDLLKLAQMLVE